MTKAFLVCHLGLGDLYCLAGAIIELSKVHSVIWVPVWLQNYDTAKELFEGFDHIWVVPIEAESQMFKISEDFGASGDAVYRCGYYHSAPCPSGIGFDQWFYKQLEIPFAFKTYNFPVDCSYSAPESHTGAEIPYIFVHDDEARGYKIDHGRLPDHKASRHPWRGAYPNALAMIPAMRMAEEIHVINSSFFHLATLIGLPEEQPKVLHRYARPYRDIDMPITDQRWEILD